MHEEFNSPACPEFEALLEDHLAGELGGPEAAKLSEHLKSCEGCRAALEFAAPSSRLLSLGEPVADPGPGFAHLVMARIREEQARTAEKSIWSPFVSLAWRFAAGAALAVIALVSYEVGNPPAHQSDVAMVSGIRSRDLISEPNAPPVNRDETLMMMAETDHGQH